MEKFFSIIPARAGSKRIPNKNLLKIKNKPLIYYSINASVKSKYILKTILYSDSTKILKVGKKFAAITDYLRPKNISKDNTTMYQTLSYFFKNNRVYKQFDYLVLLQPTSPIRNFRDINKACKLISNDKKADGLISTFKIKNFNLNTYPNKFMIKKKKYLKTISKKNIKNNNQIYLRNGPAILILKIKSIKKNLYNNKLINYEMSENRSLDLNTFSDLKKLRKNLL